MNRMFTDEWYRVTISYYLYIIYYYYNTRKCYITYQGFVFKLFFKTFYKQSLYYSNTGKLCRLKPGIGELICCVKLTSAAHRIPYKSRYRLIRHSHSFNRRRHRLWRQTKALRERSLREVLVRNCLKITQTLKTYNIKITFSYSSVLFSVQITFTGRWKIYKRK